MKKQVAIDTLKDMSSDFELDELFEKLIVLEKIERGREDVGNNRTFTHNQAKVELGKWLK